MFGSNRIIEKVKGNGNCAYNAFLFAFSQPATLDAIEATAAHEGVTPDEIFEEFIEAAAHHLNTKNNWRSVRAEITKLRTQDPDRLQILLAPVMRLLSIHLARKDSDHFARTKFPVISAFNDFILSNLGIVVRGTQEDVYRRHPFIMAKFEKLFDHLIMTNPTIFKKFNIEEYNKLRKDEFDILSSSKRRTNSEKKQLKSLQERLRAMDAELDTFISPYINEFKNWWTNFSDEYPSGYELFLEQLSKEGEWAGDLELFQLGRYFNLNIDVQLPNFTYNIHPADSPATITLCKQNDVHYDSTIERDNFLPRARTTKPHPISANSRASEPRTFPESSTESRAIVPSFTDAPPDAPSKLATTTTSSTKEMSLIGDGIFQYEKTILQAFEAGAYENKHKWKKWVLAQGIHEESNLSVEVKEDRKMALNLQREEVEEFLTRRERYKASQKDQETSDHLLAQALQDEEDRKWGFSRR